MKLMTGARGFALALLILVLPGVALAAPKFPPLTGRVVDNAQLLSPQTEAQLSAQLQQLEAQTGRQMVVATLPDLQGYEIEEFGYQLGRTWQIGRKGEDDGVLLLVAPKERRVRIEVGYGLEPVLTDALSSVIINSAILPHFKEGRFEQGVVAGTQAVIQQLALPEDEARARVAQAAAQPAPEGDGGVVVPIIFIMFIVLWALGGILRGFGGGRRRRGLGGSAWWLIPLILSSGGGRHRGGGWGGGGGFGGGGFSGGGGSFGGGGSSGSW